jgi:hypothetical protein
MSHFELLPERRPNGTIVLRAVPLPARERLRRFVRRLFGA